MRFINLVFRHTHRWDWFTPKGALLHCPSTEADPPRESSGQLPRVRDLQRTYVDRYLSGAPVDRIALRQRPGACTPAADAIDDPVSGEPWATSQDWQDAHRFYAANRTMILLALLTRSLPASFASPEGAAAIDPAGIGLEPLGSTHSRALIGDAFARVDATLDFVEALLGSDTGGEIADVLAPVRIAHHQYRRRLLQGGTSPVPGVSTWPSEELGEPISLEQLLGTVCVVVVPVREMLEASQLVAGDPPWDAWARVWAEVGRGLGLPRAFLEHQLDDKAMTYDTLARVGERIEVANRSRSLSGVRLLDHLVRHLTDGFPRPLAAFASQAVQALGDPEVNRILLAPSTPGGVLLRTAFAMVARAPEPVRRGWRAAVGAGGRVILAELRSAEAQGPSLLELFPPGCDSSSALWHRRNGRIDK
jgi:hypothetical protein